MQNCIRVSILDLDNIVFSAGTRMGGRGSNHVIRSLSGQSPPAPNRDAPLTRGHQQCRYFVSLFTMSIRPIGRPNARRCLAILSRNGHFPAGEVVGRGGLEPPTSRLSGVRSNHLSYRPILAGQSQVVEPRRIELLTS